MEKKIVYFIAKKGMIKFEGDANKYTLSDELKGQDYVANPLLAGETVDVVVDGTVVTKLTKVNVANSPVVEEKKPEVESKQASASPVQTEQMVKTAVNENVQEVPNTEAKTNVGQTIIEKEVFCASAYGVKFVGDDKWTNFSKELQVGDLKSKGLARKTIKAALEDGIVVAYEVLKEVEKESPKVEESKATEATPKAKSITREANNSTSNSIERQVALKEAGAIVRTMIEKGLDYSKVKDAISDLTKVCYKAMTEI